MTAPPMRRGDQIDDRRAAGRPRSAPRPMPEWPRHGYAPYRAWGALPDEVGWWLRLVDWLIGPDHHLLYIGITSRAGFVRWVEESDTWTWARDVSTVQRDDDIWWPTLYDAVLRDGDVVLVFDPTQPDGARPARPDERLDPRPHRWLLRDRGEEALVYRLRPDGRPARRLGTVIEGALTGEARMIKAEAPIHNRQHNEGNARAVNRRTRILPHHIAAWRRQAAHTALGWALLASLFAWAIHDGGGAAAGLSAVVDGLAAAAVLILLAQLARQATRGRVNVALQRRRTRTRRRKARR